ncbi:MAG: ATP-binding protein [Eubacterium sp.]|nr:ATP-binding protein [Eubacterium sp.]
MNHEILKSVIFDAHETIRSLEIIPREYHFVDNVNYILIGLRRAGKSTLLYKLVQELVDKGVSWNQIIYINFEDERLLEFTLTDFNDVVAVASEMTTAKPYYFFDEVQNVAGWERFARRMADANERVYITGSNAVMLSHEMESRLGGRYMTMRVYPFNFHEYMEATGVRHDETAYLTTKLNGRIRAAAERYLHDGGFPESLKFPVKRDYVDNIYQKILYGDIVARNSIRNPESLRLMIKKIAETITSEVSYGKLSGAVTAAGYKLSKSAAVDYTHFAEDAYLIFHIQNYVSKFAEKESTPKYYFSDNGLLNLFLINKDTSLLENMVAIHLYQKFRDRLFYFRSPKTGIDVDFYIPDTKTAIQVCYSLENLDTRKRETGNLVKLASSFSEVEKVKIVTREEEDRLQIDGTEIEILPLYKFLS